MTRGFLHRDEVTPLPKAPKRERASRRALPPMSKRRRAEERDLARAREIARARSRGRCEAIPRGLEHLCTGAGDDFHHILPRSRGGQHVDTNLVHLCRTAHRLVHSSPERARRLGLLA